MSDAARITDTERDLSQQSRIAAELLREIGAEDDEEFAHDAVEGETNLLEAIAAAMDEADQADALASGLATMIETYQGRKHRAEKRRDRIKAAIMQAMGMAGLKTARIPAATITVKPIAPAPVVMDESAVPAEFWKPQPPKLDRKALNAAAKDGPIPGVEMTNGGETLQVRRN